MKGAPDHFTLISYFLFHNVSHRVSYSFRVACVLFIYAVYTGIYVCLLVQINCYVDLAAYRKVIQDGLLYIPNCETRKLVTFQMFEYLIYWIPEF